MGSLELKPLEIGDFSGGLTDNFLKGGITRYQAAENFLLTVDHKLEQRNGSIIYDAVYNRIPSNSRVADLFLAINDQYLLAHNSRSIYNTLNMAPIVGPSGNPAMGEGDIYANLSHSEWQRQTFITNDQVVSSFPSFLYRDTSNAWLAKTAGLPRVYAQPVYNSVSLLSTAITLANSIRTSMLSHANDYDPAHTAPTGNLHTQLDKYSLSYLTAESFSVGDPQYPGPSPTPTPAPAATDQASLFTLVGAMALFYLNHVVNEYLLTTQNPIRLVTYHGNNLFHNLPAYCGPAAGLISYSPPTTMAQAAAQLDDLYTKWKWHRLAVNTHSYTNDYVGINRYPVTASKINLILDSQGNPQFDQAAPVPVPNFTSLYTYANKLAMIYNAHAGSGGQIQSYDPINFAAAQRDHYQIDSPLTGLGYSFINTLPLNFAVDYETFALSIFWTRALYALHQSDGYGVLFGTTAANFLKVDSTAGSANLVNVDRTDSGANVTLATGIYLGYAYAPLGSFNVSAGIQNVAKVIASGVGTATLDRQATFTQVAALVTYGSATGFHFPLSPTSFADDTTLASQALSSGSYAVGSDYTGWMDLAEEFLAAFVVHRDDVYMHWYPVVNWSQYYFNINFFIPQDLVTYSYAFQYTDTFTVEPNGIEYELLGNPTFSSSFKTEQTYPLNSTIPVPAAFTNVYPPIIVSQSQYNAQGVTFTLPVLANDMATNYATSEIKLEIYRTLSGGTVYREIASLANGTTTYTDPVNDTLGTDALTDQPTLYTTGGVIPYDQAPVAKYLHILNNTALYGYITDTGQVFPNRIRQSTPDIPYAAPAQFFLDLPDEITGISSTKTNFIILCENSIHRVTNFFTNIAQGQLTAEKVSDTLGCVSSRSIVRTEVGLFFAAKDGFYYTDGFQTIKISLELDTTYQGLSLTTAQQKRLNGTYDKLNRRIYWNVQESASDIDCNRTFVYFLNYGIKPSGVFTALSSTTNWKPSSMCLMDGLVIRGDNRGYIFKEDADTKTDPAIDTTASPANWLKAYMPFDFRTCALDFGTERYRKWVPKIHVVGKNTGNQSIQINSINDNRQRVPQDNVNGLQGVFPCAPINYVANPTWGQPNPVWGDANYNWQYDGKNDVWRRISAGGMRSAYRQFQLTNFFGGVYKYDDFPPYSFASVDATAKTATLSPAIGFTAATWPLDILGMYISFVDGGTQYLITGLDSTHKIITYSDAGNTSVNNTQAIWTIYGYRKENRVSITSITPWYAIMGDEYDSYVKSDSGLNT